MKNLSFDKVIFFLESFLVFLFPLFVFPILADSSVLPKLALLSLGTALIAFLYVLSSFAKTNQQTRSTLDLPLIFLAASAVLSALMTTNKAMSFLGEPLLIGSLTLLFFLLTWTTNDKPRLEKLILALIASGAVLGGLSVVQNVSTLLGQISKHALTFSFLNPNWSLTGSLLSQAIFLAALLPLAIGYTVKNKNRGGSFVLLLGIALGLILSAYGLFQNRPLLLDTSTGWKIATGTLGNSLENALFGFGPNHFLDAFTAFKPVEYNASPYWNLRFTVSSNFVFYLLTTLGVVGLAAFSFLAFRFFSVARNRLSISASPLEKGLIGSAAFSFALMAILPAPHVLLFLLFVVLALLVVSLGLDEVKSYAYSVKNILSVGSSRLLTMGTVFVLLLGLILFLGKALIGDYFFAKSLDAAAKNRATDTYNFQISAIKFFPENDSYRVAYSQTNLALADSLSAQPNLSDQQKQAVVQLIQQSIREGRAAASLEPKRSSVWENLSQIYRNLFNFAQGSDQWAVTSLNQAIALDPNNPRLRLDLGGIYLAAKDNQTAGQIFAQAVNLKPDFANAHYNLAQAMKLLNLKDQALQQLQLTATLICAAGQNSPDCQKVNAEITELGTKPVETPKTEAPKTTEPLATSSAQNKNLPKAKPTPAPKISSPSGNINP